ncbi:acyl-coenzyme A thioesterase THEM4-like isoform X2 [Zonotrichia albicollis]|uniref:acyl-coenzyme A thioesterase THEM4-like isoform X2 n=1 Tax=Zonotrichia albicollis TaxID=44394 RepID=UPI003D81056C
MLRGARALALFLSPVPCPRRRCHRPCPPPRDLAVPNAGWSERMRERHRELLEWARDEGWTRVPSYRQYLPQMLVQPGAGAGDRDRDRDTRLFPRAIEGDGDGFEFVTFMSVPKGRLRCLCQLGPFLEGHPGPVPLLSVLLLEAFLQRHQGRKLFLGCDLWDAEGTTLHAKATGLFIQQDLPKEPPRGGDSGR